MIIWTSRNHCIFVPEYVYVTVTFSKPISETFIDIFIKDANNLAASSAIEKRFRIDDDNLECSEEDYDLIDGIIIHKMCGEISVMCLCEHQDVDDFVNGMRELAKSCGANVTSIDYEADSSRY